MAEPRKRKRPVVPQKPTWLSRKPVAVIQQDSERFTLGNDEVAAVSEPVGCGPSWVTHKEATAENSEERSQELMKEFGEGVKQAAESALTSAVDDS